MIRCQSQDRDGVNCREEAAQFVSPPEPGGYYYAFCVIHSIAKLRVNLITREEYEVAMVLDE
jgi:hypothetical protein